MEQEYEKIRLQKSEEVAGLLEERHILGDEIKMIIHNAEAKEEKLYQPEANKYLAKMKIGSATFYVEYSISEKESYIIHTAYSHKTELVEE